jgi:hypothetical protein
MMQATSLGGLLAQSGRRRYPNDKSKDPSEASLRSCNLHRARERFVDDRRQLATDLAKPFKRGDEKKRELFTAIQFAIDAIVSINRRRTVAYRTAIAEVLANLLEDERRL